MSDRDASASFSLIKAISSFRSTFRDKLAKFQLAKFAGRRETRRKGTTTELYKKNTVPKQFKITKYPVTKQPNCSVFRKSQDRNNQSRCAVESQKNAKAYDHEREVRMET